MTDIQDLETIKHAVTRRLVGKRLPDEAVPDVLATIDAMIAARDASPVGGKQPLFQMVLLQDLLFAQTLTQNIASMPGHQPQVQVQIQTPPLFLITNMDGSGYEIADKYHRALWFYARSLEGGTALAKDEARRAKRNEEVWEERHAKIKRFLERVHEGLIQMRWTTSVPAPPVEDEESSEDDVVEVLVTARMTRAVFESLDGLARDAAYLQ